MTWFLGQKEEWLFGYTQKGSHPRSTTGEFYYILYFFRLVQEVDGFLKKTFFSEETRSPILEELA